MDVSATLLLLVALLVGPGTLLAPARGAETLIGLYGETTVVPCDHSTPPGDTPILTTWRHVQGDGTALVLTKHFHKTELTPKDSPDFHKTTHHAELTPTDSHDFHKPTHHAELTLTDRPDFHKTTHHADATQHRVSIDDRSGLVIERSALADRGVYTCVAVSRHDVRMHSVNVEVYTTVQPQIVDKAERLETDRAVALGTCVVRGAHPAAQVTWQRNGRPLTAADGTRVAVVSTVTTDPRTGLSTTSSSLRYAATREDVGARFNCRSDHRLGPVESDETLTFPLLYPTDEAVVFPALVGLLASVAAALMVLTAVLMKHFCCTTDENNVIPV